jgi:hypothetical protein
MAKAAMPDADKGRASRKGERHRWALRRGGIVGVNGR